MTKPYIAGITGRSGSGKTFFLNCFLSHFNEGEVCLISQDDYYKPKESQPVDKNGRTNFDLPQCIDDVKLLKDLKALINGKTIQKKEYTFNVEGRKARILTIQPAPIILIEGLFIFHFKEIAALLDMRIFIEADEEITLSRRLKRDMAERGYSHDSIMYQWLNHVQPAYKNYLLPYKDLADKIILNSTHITDDIISASQKLSTELRINVLNVN